MATKRKKGRYKLDEPVDEYLLNQVAKHVKPDKLSFFARDLGIPTKDIRQITDLPSTEQVIEVLTLDL